MIGEKIKQLRKEKGLTQKKLSEGICTQAHISLIEKGKLKPGLEILNLISVKLERPLIYFYDFSNMDNNIIYNTINQYILNHRYEEAYSITSEQLKYMIDDEQYKCFLEYVRTYSMYYLPVDKSPEDIIYKLKNLLRIYRLVFEKNYFLKTRIYNALGIIYASEKRFSDSLIMFSKIRFNTELENSNYLYKSTFKLRVMYNKSKLYFEVGNYLKSLQMIKEGIEMSKKMGNMSFLGGFYYYLAKNKETLEYSELEIKEAVDKSKFFFEILEKENYLLILKDEFSTYIN